MKQPNLQVNQIAFSSLANLKDFGMIVLGAGGNLQDWIQGIANTLQDEKIVTDAQTFLSASVISGNIAGHDGRTDLLLMFNPDSKPDVGKLAMWRLRFGDVSWVEDFRVNYAKDYQAEQQEAYE